VTIFMPFHTRKKWRQGDSQKSRPLFFDRRSASYGEGARRTPMARGISRIQSFLCCSIAIDIVERQIVKLFIESGRYSLNDTLFGRKSKRSCDAAG
jgi:hypothetical protein